MSKLWSYASRYGAGPETLDQLFKKPMVEGWWTAEEDKMPKFAEDLFQVIKLAEETRGLWLWPDDGDRLLRKCRLLLSILNELEGRK